jgi:hypothetical protein
MNKVTGVYEIIDQVLKYWKIDDTTFSAPAVEAVIDDNGECEKEKGLFSIL